MIIATVAQILITLSFGKKKLRKARMAMAMCLIFFEFGSNDVTRYARERRMVGPTHNHDKEQHHLQQ
jgi:hypothetical protein